MSAPPFGSGNTGFNFGQTGQPTNQPQTNIFGANAATPGYAFPSAGANTFGKTPVNQQPAFGFGTTPQQQQQQQQQQPTAPVYGFGGAAMNANPTTTATAPPVAPLSFGAQPVATTAPAAAGFPFGNSLPFGSTTQTPMSGFGAPAQTTAPTTTVNFPFGGGGGIFGNAVQTQPQAVSTAPALGFGGAPATATAGFGTFASPIAPSVPIAPVSTTAATPGFGFGGLGFGATPLATSTTGFTTTNSTPNNQIGGGLIFKTPSTTANQSIFSGNVLGGATPTATAAAAVAAAASTAAAAKPFSFANMSTPATTAGAAGATGGIFAMGAGLPQQTTIGGSMFAPTAPQTLSVGAGFLTGQTAQTTGTGFLSGQATSASGGGFLTGQTAQTTGTGFLTGQSFMPSSTSTPLTTTTGNVLTLSSQPSPITITPINTIQNQMPILSNIPSLATTTLPAPAFQIPAPSSTLASGLATTTALSAPTFTPFSGIKLGSIATSAPAMSSIPVSTSTPAAIPPPSNLTFGVTTAPTTTPIGGFTLPSLLKPTPSTSIATTTSAAVVTSSTESPFATRISTAPSTTSTAVSGAPAFAGLSSTAAPTSTIGIATTTVATTTTSTAVSTAPATMNFRQLEEAINKWTMELEEQEKVYLKQATQVNAWDRFLIKNGEKITHLNDDLERVKLDQQHLEHEIDFILAQQKELEDLLVPLEQKVEQAPSISIQQHADLEREHTYQLAENIDAQMKRMAEDLKEMIDHLNTTNSVQDSNDPIYQVGKILNAHMDSLQWIEQNTNLVQRKLEEVSQLYEVRRKDQERRFRLAYE